MPFSAEEHRKIYAELSSADENSVFAKYNITRDSDKVHFRDYVKRINKEKIKIEHDISNSFSARKCKDIHSHIPNPIGKLFFLSIVFAIIIIFPVIWIGVDFYKNGLTDKTLPLFTALTSLVTVTVGVVGWSANAWVAHRNSKAQHAISLIGTRFSNAQFIEHSSRCRAIFENGGMSYQDYKSSELDCDKEKIKNIQSIKYMLNYFEFISVGVMSGEIDMKIVKENLRGNMRYYIEKCENLIRENQMNNPSVWENFTKLYEIIKRE